MGFSGAEVDVRAVAFKYAEWGGRLFTLGSVAFEN